MLKPTWRSLATVLLVYFVAPVAIAQLPPSMGYMFPPGGVAGQSIEVTLGGYDWTPDMQLFVHDSRIKLEALTPPGPVIVPEPPYWFGKKARRPPFLLPREMRARLTIPEDVPPGIVHWQAANANGTTATGSLIVGSEPILVDSADRQRPRPSTEHGSRSLSIPSLPSRIAGQIQKIEEVDRFHFRPTRSGPLTCVMTARAIGSPLNVVLEVYDDQARLIADAADTAGDDTALTFVAVSGQKYTLHVYDVDFRGNRSFVYEMSIYEGPRVVAAVPAAGRRGVTQTVRLIGYGVASGSAQLESVNREISFAADASGETLSYRLETPYGTAGPHELLLSDLPETIASDQRQSTLHAPIAVTGLFEEPYGEDHYQVRGKQGDIWNVESTARRIGSPLDVALAIRDGNGKELARLDDLPDSTDAALEFVVPADGDYEIVVNGICPPSVVHAAVYRLSVRERAAGLGLIVPQQLNVPLGGKASLKIQANRSGGFTEPISISLSGLPQGVTTVEALVIPAKQKALSVELTAAEDVAATASLTTITGTAHLGEQTVQVAATPTLIATTMKSPFSIDAEGQDDVTKWPRGSTFPAPVLIEREEGFDGEIVLEMTSRQGRHRQGIRGPELTVPPAAVRILYPVYLPEWLETTRTSRMVVNGVAKVADPQGNIRYLVSRQKTRMGFLPGGALLKISTDQEELHVTPDAHFEVPLLISRSDLLREPVRIEVGGSDSGPLRVVRGADSYTAQHRRICLDFVADASASGEIVLPIRATVMQDGHLPVVSETQVLICVER